MRFYLVTDCIVLEQDHCISAYSLQVKSQKTDRYSAIYSSFIYDSFQLFPYSSSGSSLKYHATEVQPWNNRYLA